VLEPIKIFESSFGGSVLYENTTYVSPNTQRRMMRMKNVYKYTNRQDAIAALNDKVRRVRARCMTLFVQKQNMGDTCVVDPFDAVFDTNTDTNDVVHAKGIKKNKRKRSSDNPVQQLKRIARANAENSD
jgi:hypothetical protein